LAFGLVSGVEKEDVEAAAEEVEAADELRVRDERRVRPRGADEAERAACEAMAKANSRLRPARTPERSTKESPPPSASPSMEEEPNSLLSSLESFLSLTFPRSMPSYSTHSITAASAAEEEEEVELGLDRDGS